jgi:hypothetical protein
MISYSPKWLTIVGLLFLMLSSFFPARAEAGDPDLEFKTIRTEHFNIYYHQGLEETARVAASLCEEIHQDLSILFGWEVSDTTEVVITDNTDSANGSAAVMGRPVMRLYATPPLLDSTLQAHDYWLRVLITHEYTHITHLSIRGPAANVVNSVFGDIYLPNQMAPRWFIEGLAVLIETERTSVGRIRSSLYEMYIRADALQGRLQNLGQLSNATRDYLRGSKHYIYGSMFMAYVHKKYGMEGIVKLCHLYGDSIIPYGLNRLFKEVFGQDLVSLYDEWIAHVKREAAVLRERLIEQGLTTSRALTLGGETKGRPIFAADDQAVLLAIADGVDDPGVYRVPLGGGDPELLFITSGGTGITMDRTGRFFYSRTAPYKNVYRFHDVFTVKPGHSPPKRLTEGMRAIYSAVSPKGDRLAVVAKKGGESWLVVTDDRGHPLKTLIPAKPNHQVYEPIWSPDGRRIAAVIRRGPKVDLGLVDARTGEITYLTDDRFLEQSPAFDSTGRYLLFTSNRTGVDNIYAYDFETAHLRQVTNVLTGAFSPAVSNDGRTLAFLKYSTFGYDLHVMPFDPDRDQAAKPGSDIWGPAKPDPPPHEAESTRYNPFPTMVPTYWMLNTFIDTSWNVTLQAVTTFSDIANRHQIGTELNYHTDNKLVAGQVGYIYHGLGPTLRMGMTRQYVPKKDGFLVNGEQRDWHQVVTKGSVGLTFNIPGVDDNHGLAVGYNVVHARPFEEPEAELDPRIQIPTVPTQYLRAGFSLGWSWGSVTSSPLGISPHKGRILSADINFNHPMLGGDQVLAMFRYRWTEYVGMPWLEHHVMVLSLAGGVYVSDPPDQAGFSVGGYAEQNVVDAIINGTSPGNPSLRGYPPGAFSGSHYHSLRLGYRFPIWFPEAAYATIPVFMKQIQGAIFSDNVIISYEDLDRDDWRTSVGGELLWIFRVGYYAPLTVHTGYAHGFMKGGIHEVILLVSGGF